MLWCGRRREKEFSNLALEIAKIRIREAKETKAEYLEGIWPFCYRNLMDAIKELNSPNKMIDLKELLDQALS